MVNSHESQEVNGLVIKHDDLIMGFKSLYSYLKSAVYSEEIKDLRKSNIKAN